jgi:glycosyltransferase involved in cell wall biosynthesis
LIEIPAHPAPNHPRDTADQAPAVSVVIATFNGAARLPRVLSALARQDAPGGSFEVIVVNNASTDDTAQVIGRDPSADELRRRSVTCRTIYEPRQGSGFARICGVGAARGELVCFLDDDNIPEADYVSCGTKAFLNNPLAMAIPKVTAKWEVHPPPSIYRRRHLLAVNDYNGDSPIEFRNLIAPTITAGMWVRRSAFIEVVASRQPGSLMVGRQGESLACGEDIEIGILFAKAGYLRRYEPSLQVSHEIPTKRLETPYIRRLIRGIIRSELTLRERYVKSLGTRDHIAAIVRLVVAACAIPLFPLLVTDWKREAQFVLADRCARAMGPLSADR